MTSSVAALVAELKQRVGDAVRPADDSCVVGGVRPAAVVEPANVESVASLLSFANREGLKVLIRGGGTQESMGFPPSAGDILLSMRALNQVVDYTANDQTISVQAGMRLVTVQEALAPARQWLALDPPLEDAATIGGVLSTNVSGSRRLRYGGLRDQLLGVRVVLADGTIARGGGKVVKNVAGYDLPKLFTGALGTLGVVVEASFRVYPRPPLSGTVLVAADSFEPLCQLALGISARPLAPTAMDLFDGGANTAGRYRLAVRFESQVEAAIADQTHTCVALAGEMGLKGSMVAEEQERDIWSFANPQLQPASPTALHVLVKASLLPSDIGRWLAVMETTYARCHIGGSWRAHAGHGLISARLTGERVALVAALEELREAAHTRRGTLVVTSSPPELAEHFDVWGSSPALELMRTVKARYDPLNTLNPGRFIGRL